MEQDRTIFPASSYKESVLEPIFNDFKEHFFQEMMTLNYAHTIMLAEQFIITHNEAKMILSGLKDIEKNLDLDSLKYTGDFEDVFFYVENKLKKKIGIEVAGKLHTGRSRNDMDITMYKMKLKDYLLSLIKNLLSLVETLINVAEKNKKTLVIAYTHGQPAQPTTFGHYLAALVEILIRDVDRLFHSYQVVDKSSMGAAAITTTGFNLNRKRVAELLGFKEVQENSYGSIAAVDYLTEVYSHLKILFINLGRFTQDLGQWTGFDVNHLYVPNEFVQVSSIMPQKRNPVPIEHLRILSSITVGYCDTVINSMHNTPFTDMNDAEDPIQVIGYKAFSSGERVLRLLTNFVSGLKVNNDIIKKRIEESYVAVTELADSLVRKENISFRQAHEITSELVKLLIGRKSSLREIEYEEFKELFNRVIGREPDLSEKELRKYIDPEYFVSIRKRFGGPGYDTFSESIKGYYEKFRSYQKLYNEKKTFIKEALNRLEQIVDEYLI